MKQIEPFRIHRSKWQGQRQDIFRSKAYTNKARNKNRARNTDKHRSKTLINKFVFSGPPPHLVNDCNHSSRPTARIGSMRKERNSQPKLLQTLLLPYFTVKNLHSNSNSKTQCKLLSFFFFIYTFIHAYSETLLNTLRSRDNFITKN